MKNPVILRIAGPRMGSYRVPWGIHWWMYFNWCWECRVCGRRAKPRHPNAVMLSARSHLAENHDIVLPLSPPGH